MLLFFLYAITHRYTLLLKNCPILEIEGKTWGYEISTSIFSLLNDREAQKFSFETVHLDNTLFIMNIGRRQYLIENIYEFYHKDDGQYLV